MAGKPYDPACPECGGRGFTWTEPHHCTCGTGEQGYYGMHEPLCGAEPCALGCEVQPPRDCPDGGSCGHGCRERGCFRVATCAPLSVWGDRWPAELVAAERARGGPYWPDSPAAEVTPAMRNLARSAALALAGRVMLAGRLIDRLGTPGWLISPHLLDLGWWIADLATKGVPDPEGDSLAP